MVIDPAAAVATLKSTANSVVEGSKTLKNTAKTLKKTVQTATEAVNMAIATKDAATSLKILNLGGTTAMKSFVQKQVDGKTVTVMKTFALLPMPQIIETSYSQKWAWEQAAEGSLIQGDIYEAVRTITKGVEGVTPERLYKQGSYQLGLTLDDKIKYMYNGPETRNFSFSFLFQPNSAGEQAAIRNWIKITKFAAAPAYVAQDAFFTYPDFFEMDWFNEHKLFKTGTVAINNITVNYTPDGIWSAHVDGQPTAIRVTLSLTELDYVTKKKVNEDW